MASKRDPEPAIPEVTDAPPPLSDGQRVFAEWMAQHLPPAEEDEPAGESGVDAGQSGSG